MAPKKQRGELRVTPLLFELLRTPIAQRLMEPLPVNILKDIKA